VRTNLYVDAFNLYRSCLKGTPYKWLNLATLFEALVPKEFTLNRIRVFAGQVKDWPEDPSISERQAAYFRALRTIPNLTIHLGHFQHYRKWLHLADPEPNGPQTAFVILSQEKGSDVNLATYLIFDALERDCEAAMVVSNDTDLLLPIELVQTRLGIHLGILNPSKTPSRKLQSAVKHHQVIGHGALAASQFAPTVRNAHGREIHMPDKWKHPPY
jgi:hypothetical protein